MTAPDLVRMANQIAHFFAPYPDADAVAGVREHLEMFWTREMRQELRRLVSPGHDDAAHEDAAHDLDPLVQRAIASWPAPPSA